VKGLWNRVGGSTGVRWLRPSKGSKAGCKRVNGVVYTPDHTVPNAWLPGDALTLEESEPALLLCSRVLGGRCACAVRQHWAGVCFLPLMEPTRR
jgi:hypothetical protein